MIKLKELLSLPTLYLYDDINEANSGYSDHVLHKEITDKIYNGWISLLESIDDKNSPLSSISEEKLDFSINKGIQFNIRVAIEDVSALMPIDILLAISKESGVRAIEKASIAANTHPLEVYLVIHRNFTINNILILKKEIELLAHHEAVHIIKTRQKKHQLSFKRDEFDYKDENLWYKYHINSDEVHAYIAQINNELKQIKARNNNITFSDALKSSKIWKRYLRDIFIKSPKLKNKMLSKIANHWNNL